MKSPSLQALYAAGLPSGEIGLSARRGRFAFDDSIYRVKRQRQKFLHGVEPIIGCLSYHSNRRVDGMLVERGLQVMNVSVISDAYAIASNFLRKSGVLPDSIVTNDSLLKVIVMIFHRGETNKIRLANKAITQFRSKLEAA